MRKQWVWDNRLVGCEKLYWGDRDINMDIPAEIRKCVGFAQVEIFSPDGSKTFETIGTVFFVNKSIGCPLYTSPSPRDQRGSRMPSSA